MNRNVTVIILALLAIASSEAFSGTRTEALAALAMKSIVYGPQPEYPVEARERQLTGKGKFILRVEVKTGRVIDVELSESTGHAILDAAAMHTLSQWRFKPGVLPPISVESPHRADPMAAKDSLLTVPIKFQLKKPNQVQTTTETGKGVFLLDFDYATGQVTGVHIIKSTGSATYDAITLQKFRHWNCKPRTYRHVKVPISYTIKRNGSQ